MKNNDIKKILIYRPEHIGDYIISLPAIKTLRKNYPSSTITLVVGPWNKKLANATPYVDEVIEFDDPLVERNIGYKKIIKNLFITIKRIRELNKKIGKNYDLLVIFSKRKNSRLISFLLNAKKKLIGVNLDKRNELERDRCLRIISPLNLKEFRDVKLKIDKRDKKVVQNILKQYKGKKKVAIHLFSPIKGKNWPVEKWLTLIEKENKKIFFILGDKKDKKIIDKILGKSKRIINLSGKLDLIQLRLFLEKCDLFIGPSSGPMYIADSTKIPVIALIGPDSPPEWDPSKKNSFTIRKKPVESIEVEEVLDRLNKIF